MAWEKVGGDETGDVVAFRAPSAAAWKPPATAPKSGGPILGYGRIRWDSRDFRPDDAPLRAVVCWFEDEADGDDPELSRSGWRLVNANPYSDYMDLEAWQDLPPSPEETGWKPGITTHPVAGGFEISVGGRRREGVWPTWQAAMEAAAQIERAEQGP